MTILQFGNHMVPASATPGHVSEPRNPGIQYDSLKLQWLINSLTRYPNNVPQAMRKFNTYSAAAAAAGAGPASGGVTGEGGGGGGGKGAVGSKRKREEGGGVGEGDGGLN
jgi:ribosomal protein L12E/L44/L45/RPP1/RPP2